MVPVKYALVILIFLIVSCSREKAESAKTVSQDFPLVFLHYWSEEMGGGIEDMVQAFNENNPGYAVKQTGFDHESYKVSIKVMLKAGNPPDIFSYWAGARTESLIKKGYLSPINELWHEGDLDTLFSPTVRKACLYKGKPYMIPVTQHYVSFYYNKKIFQKYGLKAPKNWAEFTALCTILKENGEVPIALGARNLWPAQFWFDYLLLRTAGPVYRQKLMKGKASYTDAEVKRVFVLWKELIAKGYFSEKPLQKDWAEASKMVGDGTAAMTLMGTWLVGYFDHTLKLTQGKEYDYFSFPVIDEVPLTALGPIDGILLPRSPNVNKAKKVLTIFTNRAVQQAMSLGSGSLSPARAIVPDAKSPIQRSIHRELQAVEQWAFNYDLATPPPVAGKGLALFGAFITDTSSLDTKLKELQHLCDSLDASLW